MEKVGESFLKTNVTLCSQHLHQNPYFENESDTPQLGKRKPYQYHHLITVSEVRQLTILN